MSRPRGLWHDAFGFAGWVAAVVAVVIAAGILLMLRARPDGADREPPRICMEAVQAPECAQPSETHQRPLGEFSRPS